jgi:hypothetical protein
MQGNRFQVPFHIPGTLTANITIVFTAPFDCMLEHVSFVSSNASDANVKIGTTSDDDAYLLAATGLVGDSNVPAEYSRSSFVGTEYPHILDGTVMLITIDYDGSSGTAGQNVTLVLTFSEG